MHPATDAEKADFRQRFGKPIPPAWSDVHIADNLDDASLLVSGRDTKGRRQSIYSAAHTEAQAAKKFQRIHELNEHLDKLDFALERDAATVDEAGALVLIRKLGMRPGSNRDTHAAKEAFGATTLQARHARLTESGVSLSFVGKKGVNIRLTTSDLLVVETLTPRLETRTGTDRLFNTTEDHVRAYMHTAGVPDGFLLKDLRTVHANTVALREIERMDPPTNEKEFRARRREVATRVSEALGNTPAVTLASYINPTVFAAWAADPSWVNAAASEPTDPVISRAEERRLLTRWFNTVTWDQPEKGIPAVEPDPDDDDEDVTYQLAASHKAVATQFDSEVSTLPNPNPTIIHAAAKVSVDDVRTAYYAQASQSAWIREFHTHPQRLIVADHDADGTVARVDFTIGDDGTVTFAAPVPVRVEYVDQGDDAATVAASRMVYASADESRPSMVVAHLRGKHNQKSHGRRYKTPGLPGSGLRTPSTKTSSKSRREAYSSLVSGEKASIRSSELDGLLKDLTGGGDEGKKANLANLDVDGYGTLFATDKTDALDRSKMPQLGTNEEEMRPFLDLLQDNGVGFTIDEIDPTTLKPSQSEISGAKTGKLYGFMAKDGWLPGGLLITSNDGYVVDGHHRWSGAAAVRASGARPDMTVTGVVVDRPINEVLELAQSVAKFESLDFDRTAVNAARMPAGTREMAQEIRLLKRQVEAMSAQLAETEAEKAAQVKASVLDTAQREGKFSADERHKWEADYDEAPQVVTRVLASIPPRRDAGNDVTASADPDRERQWRQWDAMFSASAG